MLITAQYYLMGGKMERNQALTSGSMYSTSPLTPTQVILPATKAGTVVSQPLTATSATSAKAPTDASSR